MLSLLAPDGLVKDSLNLKRAEKEDAVLSLSFVGYSPPVSQFFLVPSTPFQVA